MITTLADVKNQLLPTVPTAAQEAQITKRIQSVTGFLHQYLNAYYRDVDDLLPRIHPGLYSSRYYQGYYSSLFQDYISFIDAGASFSGTDITVSSTIDLTDWQAGDSLEIRGSLRNDGYYTVSSVAGQVITVDRALRTEDFGRSVWFFFIDYPQGLQEVANSMIIYDVFERPKISGMKSEKIGTYSYTLSDVKTSGYPDNIINQLFPFKKLRFMA